MDLPHEIWLHIFSYLTRNKNLNIRLVCQKWNELSLSAQDWSTINIALSYNEQVTHFCEMIKNSIGRLKLRNFYLNFTYISILKLQELAEMIGVYAVSCYIMLEFPRNNVGGEYIVDRCKKLETILNATTGLKVLHIRSLSYCQLEPTFFPLKKLKELGFHQYKSQYGYRDKEELNFDILIKWIKKAPSLEILYSQFSFPYEFHKSSEISKYLQLLRGVPRVHMFVNVEKNHVKNLQNLSEVALAELCLELREAEDYNIGNALNMFLQKQASHLQTLIISSISELSNLTFPVLKNVETIMIGNGNPSRRVGKLPPFDPKCFPKLNKIVLNNFHYSLEYPFKDKEFTKVTKLHIRHYIIQDWKSMFPRLKKFETEVSSYTGSLGKLKHLLLNLPTNEHLVLKVAHKKDFEYLLANSPLSVSKLSLCICELYDAYVMWTVLTGYMDTNAWDFDVERIHKNNPMIANTIGNIPNLYKLKVSLDRHMLLPVTLLAKQQGSFPRLNKLILIGNWVFHPATNPIDGEIPYLNILKKYLNTEVSSSTDPFAVPKGKKCPENMLDRNLRSIKILYSLYNIRNNNY